MHRIALISASLLLVLVGTASADRLGGAYRGPVRADEPPGGAGAPGGGHIAVQEVAAYWPFFYEHNKEWILQDCITLRRVLTRNDSTTPPPEWVDRILPALEKAAQDPVAKVRDAAILALGKTGREAAVPILAARLFDMDRELREDAFLALGLTGQPSALPHLLEGLPDRRYRPWASLGLALAEHTDSLPAIFDHYRRALKEEKFYDAEVLATAIGHLMVDEDRLDDLAGPIKRRGAALRTLKIHICQALGHLDTKLSRSWLMRAAIDKVPDVRSAAILALDGPRTRRDQDLLKLLLGKSGLRGGHRMPRVFAIHSLSAGALPPKVWENLVELAQKPAKDTYQAQHASLALAMAGNTDANDYYLEYLKAGKRMKYRQENHSAMAMALGFTGDRRGRTDLEEIVSGKKKYDRDYRGYAALALALMDCRDSLPVIRTVLAPSGSHPRFVVHATWALGLMGSDKDVPFLLKTIASQEDGWFRARGAAAIALGLISAEESIDPLIELAGTAKDPLTRAFAVVALGWIADQDPVPRIPLLYRRFNYRARTALIDEVMSCL